MKLNIHIHKIKCIDDLTIALPIEKGLYAITGQNGAGKSTVVTCASRVFFNLRMNDYFGTTEPDASLSFSLGDATRSWHKEVDRWVQHHSETKMNIKGFYEGSLIFGNRFKDTTYESLKKLEHVDQDKLIPAHEFIRKNLGQILQGDPNFYEKLWLVSSHYEKFKGHIFFL